MHAAVKKERKKKTRPIPVQESSPLTCVASAHAEADVSDNNWFLYFRTEITIKIQNSLHDCAVTSEFSLFCMISDDFDQSDHKCTDR